MMAFTISPTFKRWPEPVSIVLDMIEDLKHMFLGGSDPLCTVDKNDHSVRGHLADLGVDALRLFPYATLLAVAIAFFVYLPVIAGGVTSIANVSNPVVPNSGAPANIVPSQPSVVAPTMVPSMTPLPTATFTPTLIPPTATPTVAVVETKSFPTFVTLNQCDLRTKYPNLSQPYLWGDKISRFVWDTYGYGGEYGDRSYYQGEPDEKLAMVTFTYTKGVGSTTVALPKEMWGPLPTNRFCLVGGEWRPLSPVEGELPINK